MVSQRSPSYYRYQEARRNARLAPIINAAVEVAIDAKDGDTTATTVLNEVEANTEALIERVDLTEESINGTVNVVSEDVLELEDSDFNVYNTNEDDISEQLKSLIEGSRRNRVNWDKMRVTFNNTEVS